MFRVFSCLTEEHDWHLVLLAGLVCFLTSLAAILLFRRAGAARGRIRAFWLLAAAAAAGCGIWATHFIAVLAYQPGVSVHYDTKLTILSLVVAMGITGCGLAVGVHGAPAWRAPLGGGIVGVGIAGMHYIGMHALEVPGRLSWSADLVAVSILLAMVFATAALAVGIARRGMLATLLAAALLALAIVSLHFTAMGAVSFVPDPTLAAEGSTLPPTMLALAIAGATSAVLGVAFVSAVMDQRLHEQLVLLDTALQNVSQGVIMFDGADRVLLSNDRYRELYGLPPDAAKPGQTMRQILQCRVAAGTFDQDPDAYLGVLESGRANIMKEVTLPDGRAVLVKVLPRPGGGWVATHEDITELRRREASFRLMFESNPVPMWVVERAGLRFLDVNAAAVEQYGYGREQFLAMRATDIAPADDQGRSRADTGADGRVRRHRRADGGNIEAAIYDRPLSFAGHDAVLVAAIDLTARKMAEDELRRTRAFLDTVIESVPASIAVREAKDDHRYVLINRACEKFLGVTRDRVIGRTVHEVLPPAAADFLEARDRDLLEQGHEIFDAESLLTTPDQGDRYLTARRLLIRDDNHQPQYLLAVIEDVTKRRMLEEQLRQSQKMEAIGQLTGGLSHDFNNLLAIIIGNLDLLRDQVGGNPDALEAVEEALGASLRGADLNRRLLAFARRQPLQPRNIDLNELVAGMTKLLERTLGEHIDIVLSTAEGLWPLVVDPTQLESALTNLVVNARDAMPRGGRLVIGTRNISIDADYAAAHGDVTAGDYVVLEVSDTGEGMRPEVVARVFEPFFTTKDKDKGTGLGLSMVFGFVKQSGGHVQAYSEVGLGTTLRLYLPRGARDAADDAAPAAPVLPRGHETVLAVEDNRALRRILVRQLQDLGYRVLEAEDAKSAIAILDRENDVDLLFTDIVLPGGVNGSELARMAAAMRAELKVLFTSGFPEAAFGPGGALPTGASLLVKPYRKDELAQRLRESLAA